MDHFPEPIKYLQQDQQVHHQEDAVDPRSRGIGPFGPNIIEPVAILALAELPFNRNALQILFASLCRQPFQFRFVFFGYFLRPAQRLPGKADTTVFEVTAIVPATINRIAQNNLRINAVVLP